MATFVLVHGAWGGGFQWREVASLLISAGHEVFRPSLTGLGERAHLTNPGVGLDTHIEDILGVLKYEDLYNVTLVGHSYAGLVISGVAERAADRISHLVFLDAFVPAHGESLLKIIGPALTEFILERARMDGNGWTTPYYPPTPNREPTPLLTGLQSVELNNPKAASLPRTYVSCTDNPEDWPFTQLLRKAADRARSFGWAIHEIEGGGHWPMESNPVKVAGVLLEIIEHPTS